MSNKHKIRWGSRAGFLAAAVGSAIGLGNIWRFPYQAYDNGGGAFLIPYFFAMLTAGIPLLIFEFGLGQKLKGSAPGIYSKLPGFKGKLEFVGWFQAILCLSIVSYYSMVVAWTFSYLGLAFTGGWGTDTNAFFYKEFLQLGDLKNGVDFSTILPHNLISLISVWLISWLILSRGLNRGIELVSRIFMPILFIMVLFIAVRVLFLEGAMTGLNYLFEPDFSKILDPGVWASAYGQIFFSMSVGFAIMITYSSYKPEKSDVVNNAFMTGLINCGFSLLAGVMIFSILGHMAHNEAKSVTDVVAAGPGLVFATIPEAINYLPAPRFMGVLFFLSLAIAGLSSFISVVQAFISPVVEKFKISHKKAVTLACAIGFALSISFATNVGLLILDIADNYINNVGVLLSALVEIIVITWVLKDSKKDYIFLQKEINEYSEIKAGLWWVISLKYITLAVLGYMAVINFIELFTNGYGGYSALHNFGFGWIIVIGCAIFAVVLHKLGGSMYKTRESKDLNK